MSEHPCFSPWKVVPDAESGCHYFRGPDCQHAQGRKQRDEDYKYIERRPNSEGPPGVELLDADAAGLLTLVQQQTRNEEPADKEKNGDAKLSVLED